MSASVSEPRWLQPARPLRWRGWLLASALLHLGLLGVLWARWGALPEGVVPAGVEVVWVAPDVPPPAAELPVEPPAAAPPVVEAPVVEAPEPQVVPQAAPPPVAPVRPPVPPRPVARARPAERATQAAPVRPSAPPPVVAAPPAPAAPVVAEISPGWRREVSGWIEAHKVYPEAARRRGDEGVVTVRFTVDRSGSVQSTSLDATSGSDPLDRAVQALLRGARVPAFPAVMPQAEVTLTVRVAFRLE